MSEDGTTKDDVKNPDGEVGDKINKMFTEDGKDTSELTHVGISIPLLTKFQTSSSSLPWVKRSPLTQRPPRAPRQSVSSSTSGGAISQRLPSAYGHL